MLKCKQGAVVGSPSCGVGVEKSATNLFKGARKSQEPVLSLGQTNGRRNIPFQCLEKLSSCLGY